MNKRERTILAVGIIAGNVSMLIAIGVSILICYSIGGIP